MSKSPDPQTIAEIDMPQRLLAAGDRYIKDVAKYFGWQSPDAIRDVSEFTVEELVARGWTKEKLIGLAEGYEAVARITPSNPSATPRAIQLNEIIRLFEEC